MLTRCYLLSPLLTLFMNASNFAVFSASSPKLIISTATLFFFIFFANRTSVRSSASTGLPTKTIMRWRWFRFCRCFNASYFVRPRKTVSKARVNMSRGTDLTCAICIPVKKLALLPIFTVCSAVKILPTSDVSVTKTSGLFPAIVMRPTVFSRLACVFDEKMRLTASFWATRRVGV